MALNVQIDNIAITFYGFKLHIAINFLHYIKNT